MLFFWIDYLLISYVSLVSVGLAIYHLMASGTALLISNDPVEAVAFYASVIIFPTLLIYLMVGIHIKNSTKYNFINNNVLASIFICNTIVFPILSLLQSLALGLDIWLFLNAILIYNILFLLLGGPLLLLIFLNKLVEISNEHIERGGAKILFVLFWLYLVITIILYSQLFQFAVYIVTFLIPYIMFFSLMLNAFIKEELPEARKPITILSYAMIVVGLVFTFLPVKQILIDRMVAILSLILGTVTRIASLD